jgi:branched-chain amino acid transport system substrate-binding protein
MKMILALVILIQASLGFSKETVQVTIASNFSGLSITSFNPFGGYFKDAVELAIFDNQKLLDKAGIDLKIHTVDYGSDDIKVIEKTKEAINSKSIAVIGYNYSSSALLAAPLHSSSGLPMISPSASANRLGTFGKYVHLGSFNNRFMVQTLAKTAVKVLGKKRILILTAVNCAYCADLANSFTEEIKVYGGEIVKNIPLLQEEQDFSKIANEAKKLNFDAVIVPNQELTAARLIIALTEAGIDKPFLGADGWGNEGPEFFRVLKGRKFTGYSVTHWHTKLNTPKSKKFVSAYLKRYQKLPNDTSVLAYDSMTLLIQSIVKTKPLTRENLESTLSQVKTFDGVTGRAYWEPHQAPKKNIVILKTTDTGFAIHKVVSPKKVSANE